MRVKIKDTTHDATYGALRGPIERDGISLYGGDVVEVDDATGQRWARIGLAEPTDADARRVEAAEPTFEKREGPVFDAVVDRRAVGDFIGGTPEGVSHPTNVAPEVALRLHQLEQENLRLKAQVGEAAVPADEPAADPLDGLALTAAQKKALEAAGYDTPEKIAVASDDDLHAVEGVGDATIAKLRG